MLFALLFIACAGEEEVQDAGVQDLPQSEDGGSNDEGGGDGSGGGNGSSNDDDDDGVEQPISIDDKDPTTEDGCELQTVVHCR